MGEENHSTFLSFRRHDFLKLGAICPPSGYPTRHPSDSRTERVKNKTHPLLSRQQVWRIRYTELGPRQGLVCESPLPPDGPAQAHGQGPVSRETLRHHKNGHSSDDVLTHRVPVPLPVGTERHSSLSPCFLISLKAGYREKSSSQSFSVSSQLHGEQPDL